MKYIINNNSPDFSCLQKIAEDQQLRQDLQIKLLQSEHQLHNLKQPQTLSHGPTVDLTDFSIQSDSLHIAPSE